MSPISKKQIYTFLTSPLFYVPLSIVLFVTFFYHLLITGNPNFIFGESVPFYGYQTEAIKQQLLNYHQIGLWDNQNGLGYSLIGHLSYQFYPLIWLTLALNPIMALRLQLVIHLILAGLAFFYLLKTFKCNTYFSIFGALLYLLNGYIYTIVVNGFNSEIYNLVWMPLTTALLWKSLFRNKSIYAVFCGIALSMHFLGLTLYAFYFNLLLLFIVFAFYFFYSVLFQRTKIIPTIITILKTGLIMFGIGVALPAVKLLPVAEFKVYSMRDTLPLYGKNWYLVDFQSLWKYLANFLINTEIISNFYTATNIGFLLLIGVSFFKRSKEVFFLIIASVIALWASLGPNIKPDLFTLFYYVLPGFKFNEYVIRYWIITDLTLPALAAMGAFYLYTKNNFFKILAVCMTLFLIFQVAMFTRYNMQVYYRGDYDYKTFDPSFSHIIGSYIRKETEPVKVVSFYGGQGKSVNDYTALLDNYLLINNPHPQFATTYQYVSLNVQNPSQEFLRKKYKLLNVMNVKYAVFQTAYDTEASLSAALHPIVKRPDGTLYTLSSYQPYIGTVTHAILLVGSNQYHDFNAYTAKVLMLDKDFNLNNVSVFSSDTLYPSDLQYFDAVILTDTYKKELSDSVLQNYKQNGGKFFVFHLKQRVYPDIRDRSNSVVTDTPAEYLSQTDENTYTHFLDSLSKQSQKAHIEINVKTPDKNVFLISTNTPTSFVRFSESYYPGWGLIIDGKKANLYMADGLVKGFILTGKGRHTVVLEYKPLSFYLGMIISILTVIGLIVYFFSLIASVNRLSVRKPVS